MKIQSSPDKITLTYNPFWYRLLALIFIVVGFIYGSFDWHAQLTCKHEGSSNGFCTLKRSSLFWPKTSIFNINDITEAKLFKSKTQHIITFSHIELITRNLKEQSLTYLGGVYGDDKEKTVYKINEFLHTRDIKTLNITDDDRVEGFFCLIFFGGMGLLSLFFIPGKYVVFDRLNDNFLFVDQYLVFKRVQFYKLGFVSHAYFEEEYSYHCTTKKVYLMLNNGKKLTIVESMDKNNRRIADLINDFLQQHQQINA